MAHTGNTKEDHTDKRENVEAVVAAVKKAMSVEALWRERADSVWNH